MSKVLVIVYSLTGTSRRVAELLCSQQNWSLGEIVEVEPRRGVLSVVRCLLDSLLRRRPKIRYEGPFPKRFDAVVLVSPIWAMRLAGPMRSFVAKRRGRLPEIAVISVMGGSGAPEAVSEIAQLAGRVPILSTAFTAREVDEGSYAGRLETFGAAVRTARESQAVIRPVTLSPQAV